MSLIDGILIFWFFLVGACVGSFLNVVVYRLPRGESLLRPGSRCPCCNHSIRPWDNIPIVSWIFLRGRCRDCGSCISGRYPMIEFVVGVWFGVSSLLALNAAPTWRISPWIFSAMIAFFGAMFFATAQIVQSGVKVPRILRWALLIASACTLFVLLSLIST